MKNFRTACWLVWLLASMAALAAPELDQPAPPLKGMLFTSQAFDLQAMRGKVVLVNFYSSYCKYCAYEIGNLETFYETHRDRGFEVIVVGVDSAQDRHRVERMLGIYGLPGTMVGELEQNGFGNDHRTPTAYVIDREGVLRSRTWGSKTPMFFAEKVLPLLEGR